MRRTKDSSASKKFNAALMDVQRIVADSGAMYQSKDLSADAIGMESLSDTRYSEYSDVKERLIGALRNSNYFMDLLGTDTDKSLVNVALESAAYTLLATNAETQYFNKTNVNTPNPIGSGMEGFVVSPMDGSVAATLESFEGIASPKYSVATALANAQAAVMGGFEDAFFPTQLVPAGQNGVDLQITIPKIMTMSPRANVETSSSFTYSIVKTSLIKALINPSLLESNATTIYPYVGSGTYPGWAVPAATIIPWTASTQGTTVQTAPIQFSVPLDVIQASADTALLQNTGQILDETDALDPIMNVGTLYIKVGITYSGTTTYAIYSQDISTQAGSLLTQVQQGRAQAYQTTGVFNFMFGNNTAPVPSTSVTGTTAQMVTAAEALLNAGSSIPFTVVSLVTLSATGDTEYGNFRVDIPANGIVASTVYDGNGNPITNTGGQALLNGISFTPIGYYPNLRRTNSNLRNNGTIIDSNTTRLYRYAVQLSAPIISQFPIGSASTTNLEALSQAARIRQNGRCVTALLNAEAILLANNGIPTNAPMPGAEFVVPTYLHDAIDVTQFVSSLNSMDNLQNLRGAIRSAMTNMINQALVLSQYPAALEICGENPANFEIIAVTDQEAIPHFLVDGDSRFLGDGRFYRFTVSNNAAFSTVNTVTNTRTSKVYFTFRRKQRNDDLHPLDFGKLLVTPSITYDVQINRNQRTVSELHTIPRLNAYVFLPILMRLDIQNLEILYSAASNAA